LQAGDRLKRIAVVSAARCDSGIYIPVIAELESRDYLAVKIWDTHKPSNQTEMNPDWVVVLGDTMPMLEAAIWAAQHNIKVAHIHGGDKTGSIDDKIRPAISMFADFHFPSLPAHADRLRSMGIPDSKIRVVGPLGVYAMHDAEFIDPMDLCLSLGLSDRPAILVIQHPVSDTWFDSGMQMGETLRAVAQFPFFQPVVIAPNGENGSAAIINAITESGMKYFPNLPYLTFVSLLKYSSVIVGNSSCGLVEAPLFGTPCVNVGTRQNGRQHGAMFQADYNANSIKRQIENALSFGRHSTCNPYALAVDGPKIIADVLEAE